MMPSVIVVAAAVISGMCSGAAIAVTPAQKCETRQMKAAGKDAACQASQLATGLRGGTPDLTRCSAALDTAFTKAVAEGGCPSTITSSAVDSRVSTLIGSISTQVAGICAPQTCPSQTCGIIPDGCGGFLDCGECENPCTSDADCINTRICVVASLNPGDHRMFCEPKLTDGRACGVQNDCLSLCCCDQGINTVSGDCFGLFFPDGSVHAVPGICEEPENCSVSGNAQCSGALAPAMDICHSGTP